MTEQKTLPQSEARAAITALQKSDPFGLFKGRSPFREKDKYDYSRHIHNYGRAMQGQPVIRDTSMIVARGAETALMINGFANGYLHMHSARDTGQILTVTNTQGKIITLTENSALYTDNRYSAAVWKFGDYRTLGPVPTTLTDIFSIIHEDEHIADYQQMQPDQLARYLLSMERNTRFVAYNNNGVLDRQGYKEWHSRASALHPEAATAINNPRINPALMLATAADEFTLVTREQAVQAASLVRLELLVDHLGLRDTAHHLLLLQQMHANLYSYVSQAEYVRRHGTFL